MIDCPLKKICAKCAVEKDVADFGVDKQKKDGITSHCKKCKQLASKKHYDTNIAYYQVRNRKFYAKLSPEKKIEYRVTCNSKESTKTKRLAWQRENKDKVRVYSQGWYSKAIPEVLSQKRKDYRKKNPEVFARHSVKRRSSEKAATPLWITDEDKEKTKLIYLKRDFINEMTGIKHEVDHIYPIQGKHSCGLHVYWNLRIITATENRRKNNSIPSYA
jgi:hypothetical protein